MKCCSRLPSCAGLAIRRSTPTPEWVRALAPALPAELTLSICSSLVRLFASVVGRVVTATRSRSLTLSAWRRADPASCTCVSAAPLRGQPGDERLADLDRLGEQYARRRHARPPRPRAPRARSPRASGRARARCAGARAAPPRAASPASRCRAPCAAAARAWVRGPGRRVIAIRPGGNFARSFSAAGIVPVSSSARIFSCSVLPIAGSSVARPVARQRRDRHRTPRARSSRPLR